MTNHPSAPSHLPDNEPPLESPKTLDTDHGPEPAKSEAGSEPTTVEKLRGLPWSMAGNAANVVFVKFTFFGSVFVLFLNTLGLNKTQTGFLLSLIPYFGLVALFAAPFVARKGYKRSFLTFWGLRQVATFAMLLTPLIGRAFGFQIMFAYVTGIMVWFALTRAIGETANMPWRQEYIPNSIRGKFAAKDSIFTTLAGFAAVLISGFVIQRAGGLNGYLALFLVGGIFGTLGVWFYSHIPGGAAIQSNQRTSSMWSGMRVALKDKNFVRFLLGMSVIIVATTPLNSFMPLFMEEEVGINAGNVILLQMGALGGSLVSSYLWGWSADRYGSKPAMMFSIFWRLFIPAIYFLTPRHTGLSLPYAMFATAMQGVIDVGWTISSARLLYVGVVPTERKAEYMSLHYAWVGLVGGTSQLLGGRLLDVTSSLSGHMGPFPLDAYTPLFLLSIVLTACSIPFFAGVRADANYGVGAFAGMFLRGNPLLAVSSLVRYQFAKDESSIVLVTEQLGQTKSPLAVDELLETLKDPRFNVRFEAIIAMARNQADPRLTQALVETLNGTELALSALAAWALGRLGDPAAIPALQAALDLPYLSIRVQAIRALGALDDTSSVPRLREELRDETDKGLQMAYASSLGKLNVQESVQDLLALLHDFRNDGARLELALALARLVGEEHTFVHLLRQVRDDPGTAMSQSISAYTKHLNGSVPTASPLPQLLKDCAVTLARGDVAGGARQLGAIAAQLPPQRYNSTSQAILAECAHSLQEFGDEHIEYILLALHTMQNGLLPPR